VRAVAWSHDVTFLSNILSSNLALIRALPRPARVGLFLFSSPGWRTAR
jgi:hypothetical protein